MKNKFNFQQFCQNPYPEAFSFTSMSTFCSCIYNSEGWLKESRQYDLYLRKTTKSRDSNMVNYGVSCYPNFKPTMPNGDW